MKIKYKNDKHIFDEKIVNGVPFLSYPKLEETGFVKHGFSTRLGGVSKGCYATMNISTSRGDDLSDVAANEKIIAAAIGVDEKKMVFTQQVHKTDVALVDESNIRQTMLETDGMITNTPGICLVTFYADCVPLYFVDPVKKAIGLSHSGWRGTVAKMANVTVAKMKEAFGTDPADLIVAVGPSICQDCYEVSEDVILQFQDEYEEKYWDDLYYKKENGKYQLNLWKANEINFLEAGVKPENMAISNVCTCCNPDVLFSHRVTGFARGNLSAFLSIKED